MISDEPPILSNFHTTFIPSSQDMIYDSPSVFHANIRFERIVILCQRLQGETYPISRNHHLLHIEIEVPSNNDILFS